MSIDEAITILQAAKDGKAEWRNRCSESKVWYPYKEISGVDVLGQSDFEFRVKPEPPKPREWRVHWVEGMHKPEIFCEWDGNTTKCPNCIHVREVLEVPSMEPQQPKSACVFG